MVTRFAPKANEGLRVWSLEPTKEHLHDVAGYVAAAWGLGATAVGTVDVAAGPFPMGATHALDRPGDKWHPTHAELSADEVSVPFIIKWFLATEVRLRILIVRLPPSYAPLTTPHSPLTTHHYHSPTPTTHHAPLTNTHHSPSTPGASLPSLPRQ